MEKKRPNTATTLADEIDKNKKYSKMLGGGRPDTSTKKPAMISKGTGIFLIIMLLAFLVIVLSGCCGSHPSYEELEDKGTVERISDERFLSSDNISIVQFSADWCGYCKKQYPNMIEVSNMEEYSDVNFYILDVENCEKSSDDIYDEYDINGIPHTILFVNGEEVYNGRGFKSSEELKEMLTHINE